MSRDAHQQTWGQPVFEAILERSPGVNLEEFKRLHPIVHKQFVAEGRVDVVTEQNLAAIDRVHSLGLLAFILTNRTSVEMEHMMAPAHSLATRIDAFYHHDNMVFHKPDPKAFSQIEKEHGLKPSECIYIGDTISDAASATGAGLSFVACLESGLRNVEEFSEYPLLGTVDHFSDIPLLLEKVLKLQHLT